MTTTSYRDHVSSLQDWLAAAKPGAAIAFGAACAERQWPVYTRATQGIAWAAADTLRAVLDALWDSATGVDEFGAHLVKSAQAAIPTEIESDAEAAASEIATGIWGLAATALDREPIRVVDTAKMGLNLIETFLYEELGLPVSPTSDAAIDAHDLMQREIFRQRNDWTILGPDAAPPVIGDLRKRWVGESILAEFWYP